ncbi:MAG: STAS domain-containing protein [Puniceicoccales bacterium]|nr:STAS domain-containing protein [Puniceicoccales bacterium]
MEKILVFDGEFSIIINVLALTYEGLLCHTYLMDNKEESVYWINENEDSVLVRIKGRATYLNCSSLNEFLQKKLRENCVKYCFLFEECSGIDSTCLGILAGLALKLRNPGGLCIFSGLNAKLLETVKLLGLDLWVQLVDDIARVEQVGFCLKNEQQRGVQSEFLLNAHKFLMEINAQNRVRFQDVVQYLSSQK